jgi:hypothetical protein
MAWIGLAFLLLSILFTTNAARFAESWAQYGVSSWAVACSTILVYLSSLSIYHYFLYPRYISPYRALPLAKVDKTIKKIPGVFFFFLQLFFSH